MLVGAVAFFLLPSASLAAGIIPGACIGGIGLWDSSAQVLRNGASRYPNEEASRTGHRMGLRKGLRDAHPLGLRALAEQADRAQYLIEKSGLSDGGRGGGSDPQRRRFMPPSPGLRCDARGCDVERRWGRSTNFWLKNGRVTEIAVSLDRATTTGLCTHPTGVAATASTPTVSSLR